MINNISPENIIEAVANMLTLSNTTPHLVEDVFDDNEIDGRVFPDIKSAFNWQIDELSLDGILDEIKSHKMDMTKLNDPDKFKEWYVEGHENFYVVTALDRTLVVYLY